MLLSVPASQKTELHIYEATYDLLTNERFNIVQREEHMMPKPFVLNDAIVVKKVIKIE